MSFFRDRIEGHPDFIRLIFEEGGVRFRGGSGAALCPFHDDQHPSLWVSLDTSAWKCLACGAKGDLVGFWSRVKGFSAAEAISDLGTRLGLNATRTTRKARVIRTARYEARNAASELVAVHVRQDLSDGDKRFRWERDGRPGLGGLPVTDLPLYGAELVAGWKPEIPIVLTEGEGKCDVLRAKGFYAVATTTGANGTPGDESLAVVHGRNVILWRDLDEAGRGHMERIASRLRGKAQRLRLLEWGTEPGDDAANFFARGGTREQLRELCRLAPEWTASVLELSPAGSLELIPLGNLLDKPRPETSYLVEGLLLAGGLSSLVAKPKVGKSTFARQLCLAVARGGKFLGRPCSKGPVFYLALEEREVDVVDHFRRMGAKPEDQIRIFCGTAPDDVLPRLREAIEREKPLLVVIDTIFRLARVRDVNDYATILRATEPVLRIARECGAHVMFLHHEPKGAANRADVDAPLGSTAIAGTVDTLIRLRRGERYRTLSTVQRIGEDLPETVLEFNSETKIASIGETREEADENRLTIEIEEALRGKIGPLDENDLLDEVEGKTGLKRKALRRLVREGRVRRSGEGVKGDPYGYSLDSRFLVPEGTGERGSENRETSEKPLQSEPNSRSRENPQPQTVEEQAGTGNPPPGTADSTLQATVEGYPRSEEERFL